MGGRHTGVEVEPTSFVGTHAKLELGGGGSSWPRRREKGVATREWEQWQVILGWHIEALQRKARHRVLARGS